MVTFEKSDLIFWFLKLNLNSSKLILNFILAPNNTLVNKIYKKFMSKSDRCFILNTDTVLYYDSTKSKYFQNLVFLIPDTLHELMISFAYLTKTNLFYTISLSLLENLRTFYLSKKLSKEKKNFIDKK